MNKSMTLSVSIDSSPAKVYDYISDPEHMPEWTKGFALSVRKDGREWKVGTPDGPVTLRFAVKNTFGVLDHYIAPLHGPEIFVPMRVVSNDYGSEVLFTLFRAPGTSEEEFSRDAELVCQKLENLRETLERVPAAARPVAAR